MQILIKNMDVEGEIASDNFPDVHFTTVVYV